MYFSLVDIAENVRAKHKALCALHKRASMQSSYPASAQLLKLRCLPENVDEEADERSVGMDFLNELMMGSVYDTGQGPREHGENWSDLPPQNECHEIHLNVEAHPEEQKRDVGGGSVSHEMSSFAGHKMVATCTSTHQVAVDGEMTHSEMASDKLENDMLFHIEDVKVINDEIGWQKQQFRSRGRAQKQWMRKFASEKSDSGNKRLSGDVSTPNPFAPTRSVEDRLSSTGTINTDASSVRKVYASNCRWFVSTGGLCPYGNRCKFKHSPTAEVNNQPATRSDRISASIATQHTSTRT